MDVSCCGSSTSTEGNTEVNKIPGCEYKNAFNWGDHIVKKQPEAMRTLGILK